MSRSDVIVLIAAIVAWGAVKMHNDIRWPK